MTTLALAVDVSHRYHRAPRAFRRAARATPLALLAACGFSSTATPAAVALDELVAARGGLDIPPARRTEGAPSAPSADGDYLCSTIDVDEVRHVSQQLLQGAQAEVIWPGAIVQGSARSSVAPVPVVADRAPLPIKLLSDAGEARTATLEAPSAASFRAALAALIPATTSGAPAVPVTTTIEEVASAAQLAAALGVSGQSPVAAAVAEGFDFTRLTKRSRLVAIVSQRDFAVEVAPPAQPHELFAPTVAPDTLAEAIGDAPPLYVASVRYGRRLVLTFETELARNELEGAVRYALLGAGAALPSTSITHQEVLSRTQMMAYTVGGAREVTSARVWSYTDLVNLVADTTGAQRKPPVAIEYTLAQLVNNAPAPVVYPAAYPIRRCERGLQRLRVVLERITVDSSGGDPNGNLELYGTVDAIGAIGNARLLTWSETAPVQVAAGASTTASGVLGEAILAAGPQPGSVLRLLTSLGEDDSNENPTSDDDSFGDVTDDARFEDGWRRTLQLHRASGTQRVTLQVSIAPVP